MGIVAAKLALAWFHMLPLPNLVFVNLSLAVLSGAVLSGATQSFGSRLVRRRGANDPAKCQSMQDQTQPNPNLPGQNQSKYRLD